MFTVSLRHSGMCVDVHDNVHYSEHTRYGMNAMNATQARANLFKLMAEVNENSEPVMLTNNKGKNAILVGEDDWNAIQETLYLNSIPSMTESLLTGKATPLEDTVPESEVSW